MDCRGLEGKLALVGVHTGPGLGVSTNKAPLAHLPAHWHTEHGTRNQFTPASLEQETLHTNAFAHTFYCVFSTHIHSQWLTSHPNINAHDPQTHEYQPHCCGCVIWASWLVSLLWIFYKKLYTKWVNLILGLIEGRAELSSAYIKSWEKLWLIVNRLTNAMQICSSAVFLPSWICYQLSLNWISVSFSKYMYL